ncbi:unnamed protein product [Spirodela intermedia]|uniref:YdbS-like PH domain-containing protein n=1 Tax=Spirodela intermedia TaxID=51605 RepID=A0A7I8IPW6_SPIIN|nr:unnamed protein product [Spirodela intermedia]CAA6659533.1 unnamed protein product [Spirodela intermedia]
MASSSSSSPISPLLVSSRIGRLHLPPDWPTPPSLQTHHEIPRQNQGFCLIIDQQPHRRRCRRRPRREGRRCRGRSHLLRWGRHYGDLLANLLLGFTLLWLPLTIAAVSRAFFLRYRFTNLRSPDFSYKVIKDVQVVPRFIGEWGDIVITLKDGTKVDLRSVPKFREIAEYCLYMAGEGAKPSGEGSRAKGF